jgi:hypothetical protein
VVKQSEQAERAAEGERREDRSPQGQDHWAWFTMAVPVRGAQTISGATV